MGSGSLLVWVIICMISCKNTSIYWKQSIPACRLMSFKMERKKIIRGLYNSNYGEVVFASI